MTSVERELQRVHREGVHVNGRQDGGLVAVGAGSGVDVETHGVVAGSCVGCTGIDHWISGVGGAGAGIVVRPAVRQVVDRYRSGGGAAVGIEILHERQSGDQVALGGRSINVGHAAEFAAATVGLDIEVIAHGGTQTGHGVRIVVNRLCHGDGGSGSEAGRTVGDHPGSGGTHFGPAQCDAVGRGRRGDHVGGFRTSRDGLHADVIDITVVVAGGRHAGSQSDVFARSGILVERNLVIGIRSG